MVFGELILGSYGMDQGGKTEDRQADEKPWDIIWGDH